MSGVKDSIVDIRQSEKNRIMAGIRRAENFSSELDSRISAANNNLRGEFQRSFADINSRQDRYEQNLSSLKGDIRGLEKTQNRRMRDLNRKMERGFDDAHRRMRDINHRMQEGFKEVGRQINDVHHRIDDTNKRMKAGFDRADRRIGQVQSNVDALGRHVDSELHRQRREYTGLIEEQGRVFQQEIQQQNQIFTTALEEQRQVLQSQINKVAGHIQRKEVNEQKAARILLEDIRQVLDNIDKNTRHEKFKPGALDKIKTDLSLAENSYQSGHYQAVISSVQERYIEAQELRLELARLEHEWNMYLLQAKTSAAEVLAHCETQEATSFTIDTEEGSEEVAAEIDYWTDGKLTTLRQKVEMEIKQLDSDEISLESLKESIAKSTEWMQESEEITEEAREALVKSQVRQNISQSVADSFEGTGWYVTDSTYQGKDQRSSLHVKFESPTGDEIVTIVHPEKALDGEIRNRLEVNFFDKSNDERFRHARIKEMHERMREEGVDVAAPQTRAGYETGPGDESVRDFERVREQQASSDQK